MKNCVAIFLYLFISLIISISYAQNWEAITPVEKIKGDNSQEKSTGNIERREQEQINKNFSNNEELTLSTGHNENESHGHELNFFSFSYEETPPLIANIINFLLLVFILFYFGKKPINNYLQARQNDIKSKIEEAQKIKSEFEKKYSEYTKKLEQLDEELNRLKTEFIEIGEKERDRIVSAAQLKAEKMKADIKKVIEMERKHVSDILRKEAIELGVSVATKLLNEKLTPIQRDEILKEGVISFEKEFETKT